MKLLETERLILRGFVPGDAEDVYAYASNPKVGPPASWPPHESLDESRRIVHMFIQAGECWALVLKETGRVIGSLGLHRDAKRTLDAARMIGYVLSEPYWGRGLMPEAVRAVMRYAFCELRMEILSAYYYPFNVQSKRVMEKCGMAYEGTLRRATRSYAGKVYDEVCYSITREEWAAQNELSREREAGYPAF